MGDRRELHVLTHSFPTRRFSDLVSAMVSFISASMRATSLRPISWISRGVRSSVEYCLILERYQASPSGTSLAASVFRVFGKRSEEHTSELQSLMRISYAVFCFKHKSITVHSTNLSHSQVR